LQDKTGDKRNTVELADALQPPSVRFRRE